MYRFRARLFAGEFRGRYGFTLIELSVFSAIFLVVTIVFMTILITIVRIQARQTAAAEVNQQSQFLLQAIQRYVEQASAIDMPQDAPGSALVLRMANSTPGSNYTIDPTYLCLGDSLRPDGGVCASGGNSTEVYLQEAGNQAQSLTSDKVRVTDLQFVKHANLSGHDSVAVSFTMEYASDNPQRQFSQSIRVSIARSGPVVFNDSISVSVGGYNMGTLNPPARWRSVNDLIYFASSTPSSVATSTVGIGVVHPIQKFEVDGGVWLQKQFGDTPPVACDSTTRGSFMVWGNTTDTIGVCLNGASGFQWFIIPT